MSALGFDPAQWPRISELLDQALALAPDRREQWLAGLASADAGLRGTLASPSRGPTRSCPRWAPARRAARPRPATGPATPWARTGC
jgi:hypothetical protein